MTSFSSLLACATVAALAGLGTARATAEDPPVAGREPIAIIVHPENPLSNVKLAELRSLLRLDRQFWPDRTRVALYLPAADSPEKQALNSLVYKMTEKELQRYWTGKVFAGDIPSIPPVVRTPAAALKLVSESRGAISVVPAKDLPAGVKVLSIDGFVPGHRDYPLFTAKSDPSSSPGNP